MKKNEMICSCYVSYFHDLDEFIDSFILIFQDISSKWKIYVKSSKIDNIYSWTQLGSNERIILKLALSFIDRFEKFFSNIDKYFLNTNCGTCIEIG